MTIFAAIVLSLTLSLHNFNLTNNSEAAYVTVFPYSYHSPLFYDHSLHLRAVGDIMFHKGLQAYAIAHKDGFKPLFEDVSEELSKADITFGNLEAPSAKSFKHSGWPRFNAHPSVLPVLKKVGFDILSTANNHTMDKGNKGVIETIKALEKLGIAYIGTRLENDPPLKIIEKNGMKLGFLAFAEHTNGIPVPKKGAKIYLIEKGNKDQLNDALDLIKASKAKVDFLIISIHFGGEYLLKPEDYKRELVHRLLEAGGDFILGHHPHVLQEGEKYLTKDGRETFIVYSLGNFISGQNRNIRYANRKSVKAYRSDGVILDAHLVKKNNTVYIQKVGFIPTFTSVALEKVKLKNNKQVKPGKSKPKIRTMYGYKVINIPKVIGELKNSKKANKEFIAVLEYRNQLIKNLYLHTDKKVKLKKKSKKLKKSKRKHSRRKKKKTMKRLKKAEVRK